MSTSTLQAPYLQSNSAVGVPNPDADATFTNDEVDSFHRDDAMTAGMMAVILAMAFAVLLVLVIGVTVWTMIVAG